CHTQPFIFQRAITGIRSVTPDDNHNPKVSSQIVLVLSYDLPQTAQDTIAYGCVAEASRCDKSGPRRTGILDTERGKQHQLPALPAPLLLHALELRCARQPLAFREGKHASSRHY